MCLWVSHKKKVFFTSLKSLKKEVGSGVVSGCISHRYGSGDPDPHKYVMVPQHCLPGSRSASIISLLIPILSKIRDQRGVGLRSGSGYRDPDPHQ
jgi:hypothetical protein